MTQRIRYAVVGLGHFAQTAILPAFDGAKSTSELVALVSGEIEKRQVLAKEYGVTLTSDYDGYDALLASGQIDAVYIATPNASHLDFAVRAAKAGVHVLVEKPLAVTVAEAKKMIAACKKARVKLMCAYRLHFEASTLSANEEVQSGALGEPRIYTSTFTQMVDPANSRFVPAREGGGPVYDVGVYCLNTARQLFHAEPIEVFAMFTPARLGRNDVEEQAAVVLRFPGERLATFAVSFVAVHDSRYELIGEKGMISGTPAFSHAAPLAHEVKIGERTNRKTFAGRDQLAAVLDHFSRAVIDGHEPEPSGEEGLRDLRVIEAIFKSVKTRRPVTLPKLTARRAATRKQERFIAPSKKKRPQVDVAAPRK